MPPLTHEPVAGPVPTVTEALDLLAEGSLTATDLLRRCDANRALWDLRVGTYLHLSEAAWETAAAVDRARARGGDLGPLAGVPLAVKDIVTTADAPTSAQSLVHAPGYYGDRDAPVVARLRAAGAVLTGKTTTMELALGFPDGEKPFPAPRNPWRPGHWSGGSSSGTANGVATGQFLGGVGTDTAGSIRMPSAWCGITGLKPTYGRVPKAGVVPLGWSLDHVGPMARTALDCAVLLEVMAGAHTDDPASADVPAPRLRAAVEAATLGGLRVGVVREPVERPEADAGVVRAFEAALGVLADGGAELVDVVLPWYAEVHEVTMGSLLAEAFAYHRTTLRERWHELGRATRAALAQGACIGAGDYVQMQRVRRMARAELDVLLEEVDVLVTPVSTLPAPALDVLDFDAVVASFCVPYWNATGHPALSVPMGLSTSGLPVGLQICGPAFDEEAVLAAGHAFQQRTDHHLHVPTLTEEQP